MCNCPNKVSIMFSQLMQQKSIIRIAKNKLAIKISQAKKIAKLYEIARSGPSAITSPLVGSARTPPLITKERYAIFVTNDFAMRSGVSFEYTPSVLSMYLRK
jgi:hypothetical protein